MREGEREEGTDGQAVEKTRAEREEEDRWGGEGRGREERRGTHSLPCSPNVHYG